MKELLDKISSYNLFNYLVPGILFVYLADRFTSLSLIQENLLMAFFVYYFVGLIISRFGSLIVEPFLKKIKLVKFADYKDFVKISKTDPKLDILSESNNMYRTISSMSILLLIVMLYDVIESYMKSIVQFRPYILVIVLIAIFIASYRKQTSYITKRIESQKKAK